MEQVIQRLPALVPNRFSIDDSQVLHPTSIEQTDEAFAEFLGIKHCPVCLKVPRYPAAITFPTCTHVGCEECFRKVNVCPVGRCGPCRSKSNIVPYRSWPLLAQVAFNQDLLVTCLECKEFHWGTVELLANHEIYECPKRIVKCPNQCKVQGTPEEILKHYLKCDKKRYEFTLEDVGDSVKPTVENGSFGVSPSTAPKYKRGQMSYLNHVMRTTVFDV